ncbi:Hypothetical predicted protein [Cloeon dipterum]|uniref:DUF659 domain-containing protein n=1 Tax=Cloeon dipterum TaxID=197152 RepID=A0A8S1DIU2_9INSE|nr:Hypothetical predicted protein [Cloeon dipterum]
MKIWAGMTCMGVGVTINKGPAGISREPGELLLLFGVYSRLKRFVNYLAPWYQVPWRKTFNKILDHTYISGQKFMKKELEGKTVSLTLDLATVLNSTRHFIVCSVHYLADRSSNIMKCCTLYVSQMTQRSTSADICRSLNTALVEFGVDVDQVISTCTDRGANVLKACKDLFGENKVTSCVCHLADNVVQDSLYSLPIVNALLKDVKQIAGFIKRSPTAANLLRTFQMQIGKTAHEDIFIVNMYA